MINVAGYLAESMISSSKVEDVSLVLVSSDLIQDFVNEIKDVAESIVIDDNEVLKNIHWSWYKINGKSGMVYVPESIKEHNITVKAPPRIMDIGEKQDVNFVVTPKTFGLICTMIAATTIAAQIRDKRDKGLGSDKKILGLMKRQLDFHIDFFTELYITLELGLIKTWSHINGKDFSEDIDGKTTSVDLDSIFSIVNSYSAIKLVIARA